MIIEADLSKSARHVALTIAVRFNDKGEIPEAYRVSITTIAANCKLRRDTVIPAIKELETKGWLGVDRGKGRRASRYWSLIPTSIAVAETGPQDLEGMPLAVSQPGLAVAQTGASGPERETQSPFPTESPRAPIGNIIRELSEQFQIDEEAS
jgi:hypothetical protein